LYLELEQLRFRDKLSYALEIDPDINTLNCEVPLFLLQPYVENAVWHGLNLKKQEGKIEIKISRENENLHCIVIDNGIGRLKATELRMKNNPQHQSHGLQINENRLQLLAKLYGQKIKTNITDLYHDDGEAAGTRVDVWVAFKTGT